MAYLYVGNYLKLGSKIIFNHVGSTLSREFKKAVYKMVPITLTMNKLKKVQESRPQNDNNGSLRKLPLSAFLLSFFCSFK